MWFVFDEKEYRISGLDRHVPAESRDRTEISIVRLFR